MTKERHKDQRSNMAMGMVDDVVPSTPGDAANAIEDAVDLLRGLGGHHRDQVERPAHHVQRADTSDSAQRLLNVVTSLRANDDGDIGAVTRCPLATGEDSNKLV
jgi:hypothetical protein